MQQSGKKTIAHTIHTCTHVLDWEAFVEFPYDNIPCTGTLFNNLKGVHYKLLTKNFKNNMLLMLLVLNTQQQSLRSFVSILNASLL